MAKKGKKQKSGTTVSLDIASQTLVHDLRNLIGDARADVARTVNSTLVQLYWQIGTRVRTEVLKDERADYGERIVQTVSAQLTSEFCLLYTSPSPRD